MASTKAAQRRSAAEEVCWTLLVMMDLGGIEGGGETEKERRDWRELLAKPMLEWCYLAVETGIMESELDQYKVKGDL